ncbi:MAG: hypothetical protein VXZ38_06150, partial [Planctomycetota bacterium]|nr:hypothetical protein [Planctomycetota bacterium]
MGLRQVARTAKRAALFSLIATFSASSAHLQAADITDAANARVATYQTEEGDSFFAVALQPSAEEAILESVRSRPADVIVIVDTSATQVGEFREDSITALDAILGRLRPQDRVRVFAADVKTSELTTGFIGADEASVSLKVLAKRLPLGNTNLMEALTVTSDTFSDEAANRTRSIVYVGDGTAIDTMGNESSFATMVDSLREKQISLHSVAIGATRNIELMGILANQTGGVIGVVGDDTSTGAEAIATRIADSAKMSAIWVKEAKLPGGMESVQSDRLPPLRLDRDSILLGTAASLSENGQLEIIGESAEDTIRLISTVTVEENHPDFAFLPGLVRQSTDNDGLMLPSAGSDMLRQTIQVLAQQADQLVHAANIALQQGNKSGAKAVVRKALEADPNNADAQAIDRIMGNRLIIQNQQADDIFGSPASAPAQADENENPFADTVQNTPAPAPAAPVAGDDDLNEVPGNLLNQVQAGREAQEGRWRAEVRAQLREANRRLRDTPVGVAGSLKGLLANLEVLPDISPQTRQELTSQVRASIQVASRREASFLESQRNLEQVAQGAASSQRMLQDRVRREATLKVLSQQMNALVDEERYAEAQNVSVDFAEDAGITITKNSVEGQQFVEEPLMLEAYAHDKKLKVLRERAFVDALALVLKSNIPFVDEPPIQYPDSDWWRSMSRRRIERYGAIELVGDNETERRIQAALSDETSFSFVELPLSDAVQQISEAHD